MTTVDDVADWWGTAVSHMEPGVIELRGRPVQDLIGSVSFVETIWMMLRGDLPDPRAARLKFAQPFAASTVDGIDTEDFRDGHDNRTESQPLGG